MWLVNVTSMIFPWIRFGVTVNSNLTRIIQMLLMEELVEMNVLVQCVLYQLYQTCVNGWVKNRVTVSEIYQQRVTSLHMLCFPSYLTTADAFLLFHHWIICKCFPFRARSTGHWSFSKIVSQPFKSNCGFVTTFDNKQPIISEVLTTVTLGGEGLSGAVAALSASAL